MNSPGRPASPDMSGGLAPDQLLGGGRFRVKRMLGQGGMGVVWLAQDLRLQEAVALKFLPPELLFDPTALNDLRRETLRSRKLSHPNIVRIYDLFTAPEEPAFISMEYVDGLDLHYYRESRSPKILTWEFLAPLLRQLCAALSYAHGEKVVHRDIKPANLILDSSGRLKLADFGLSGVMQDSMTRVTGRVASGGTLWFMSPQQADGKPPQIADDIYSLGATLYELLTSRPPFYQGDIAYQIRHTRPEPLAQRLLDLELTNEIPSEVSALVMACLAKDPAQRPASIQAILEFLEGAEQVRAAAPTRTRTEAEVAKRVEEAPVTSSRRVTESEGKATTAILERQDQTEQPPSSSQVEVEEKPRVALWACVTAAAVLAAGFCGWYWGRHFSPPKRMTQVTPQLNSSSVTNGSTQSSAVPVVAQGRVDGSKNVEHVDTLQPQSQQSYHPGFKKPAATPGSYDAERDFSIWSNPNGAWSYGYLESLSGPFGLLRARVNFSSGNGVPISSWHYRNQEQPAVCQVVGTNTAVSGGGAFVGPPGTLFYSPGLGKLKYGTIRFTVPSGQAGTYRLETSVRSSFDGNAVADCYFYVLRNGDPLLGRYIPARTSTEYRDRIRLEAGDNIDFAVGHGKSTLPPGLKIKATLNLLNDSNVATSTNAGNAGVQ